MNKKISIITINYNNANGLLNTITSVKKQSSSNFEFIIIDGNSTDESVDIINNNKQYINYHLVENDNGIYDAMNKGISKATSNYLLFLNSGDTFYNNKVIENILPYLLDENINVYYGMPNIIMNNGKQIILKEIPYIMNLKFLLNSTINHQSSIINKKKLIQSNLYDCNCKYIADYDFYLKTYLQNPLSFKYIPLVVANYKLDGISSIPENRIAIENERLKIQQKYYSNEIIETNIKLFNIENNKYFWLLNNNSSTLFFKVIKYYYKTIKAFFYRILIC